MPTLAVMLGVSHESDSHSNSGTRYAARKQSSRETGIGPDSRHQHHGSERPKAKRTPGLYILAGIMMVTHVILFGNTGIPGCAVIIASCQGYRAYQGLHRDSGNRLWNNMRLGRAQHAAHFGCWNIEKAMILHVDLSCEPAGCRDRFPARCGLPG